MKKIVYLITLTFFAFMVVSFSVAEEAQVLVFKIHDQEPGNSAAFIPIRPEYSPKNKLDPFKPWFSENQPKPAPVHHQTDCISNPVLKDMDLSQLELTGIVIKDRQSIALIQGANKKGHIIYKETCIGKGKVVEILDDRVIIQEEMQDLSGNVKVKKTEMKLKRRAN